MLNRISSPRWVTVVKDRKNNMHSQLRSEDNDIEIGAEAPADFPRVHVD